MSNRTREADASLKELCSNLSAGFHAVAQPLAILRASLGPESAEHLNLEELRHLAANSAVEIERVCALFSCMQQLVNLEAAHPQLQPTPILPLLLEACEGVQLLFEEEGISLRSSMPENCDPVLIDKRRTQQALSSLLLMVHSVSHSPDTVELIVLPRAHHVSVVVRNPNPRLATMRPEWSLNMALAETNLRSQTAGFSWSLCPFHVQIDFRKAVLLNYC